jgi:hypothetical protein
MKSFVRDFLANEEYSSYRVFNSVNIKSKRLRFRLSKSQQVLNRANYHILSGLEDVKAQVLRIKAKIETSIRQGTDLRKERLRLVLMGNPGTGISLLNPSLIILIMQRQNHCD